jgi:type I restriction enzyme S subunit
VKQDLKDEPASVLLKKIAAEKARLVADGKIKKSEPLPPIKPGEVPFDVPEGWAWVRFGDATINRDGERIPVSREERASRVGPYDYYGASGVIDKIDDFLFDKPLLLIGEDGANLVNRSTPIAFIASGKYWVNNHAHVLDGWSFEYLRYLEVYINAIDLIPYVTGTAQPKMNQAKMNSIAVALPPLAEQRRIVAKVDRLMSLCDEMESKLTGARERAERLVGAVVGQFQGNGAAA